MAEKIDFVLDFGAHALLRLLTSYASDFSTVLDIGSGGGEHAKFLRLFGKRAYTTDLHEEADYQGDFLTYEFPEKFDAVFCSHVLEHQRNVGMFLEKIYTVLSDNGVLAIAVPCHARDTLISGHITSWNAGILIYNLVLAGFDCSAAHVHQGQDLNLVVRKRPARGGDVLGPSAWSSVADLAPYFPFPVQDYMNCEILNIDWGTGYNLPPIGRPVTLHINSRTFGEVTFDWT